MEPLKKRDLRIRLNKETAEALGFLMDEQNISATQLITKLIFTATKEAKDKQNDISNNTKQQS